MPEKEITAIEELKFEHRIIEQMLAVMDRAVQKTAHGEDISAQFLRRVMDFLGNFIDKCHQGKEEDFLFPLLIKRGYSRRSGPLGMMLLEHGKGRSYARAIDDASRLFIAGDKTSLPVAMQNMKAYSELLQQHIAKEENLIFISADQVLNVKEQDELLEKFDGIEKERLGTGKHEESIQMLKDLAGELQPLN